MAESFTYKAFGLIIKSEFEIPELCGYNGIPEVEIAFGEAPQKLKKISNDVVTKHFVIEAKVRDKIFFTCLSMDFAHRYKK